MSLLSVRHINTGYDKKQVLFDVSFEIEEGEKILLVGSNGSGKSTLFKAVYGLLPWRDARADIQFKNENITCTKPYGLIKKGLMYVPQKNELYEDMAVRENLLMGALHLGDQKKSKKLLGEVFEQMPILKAKSGQTVNSLSGGERKLLSMGMVLMNKPKLLFYDEPLAGLSSNNASFVLDWLKKINEKRTAIVIIEHRIKETFSFADKVLGLKLGRKSIDMLDSIEKIKSFMV